MRQMTYSNTFRTQGLYCRDVLIRCMDFRFHAALEQGLRDLLAYEGGFECFDSPGAGGGGSKAIIDERSREVVFAALNLAMEKHEASRIVVADHIDCAAYGGSGLHQDAAAEERFHAERLQEAYDILRETYPSLQIVPVYQDWETIKQVDMVIVRPSRPPVPRKA